MIFAVFADVHSNTEALKTVIKDIKARGIDKIFCAGDLVGYAPFPNEVINFIRSENIPTVMGNYDDAIGNYRLICGCDYKDEKSLKLAEQSILYTTQETTEDNKQWLRQLPKQISFATDGLELLIVHGSPRQLNEYLFTTTPDDYLKMLLDEAECDVLICGHTHIPYHKALGKKHVINVGSAGKPKHGNPNAVYAVITLNSGDVQADFIEVPYNHEVTARAIETKGLPVDFAENIRSGQA